MEHYTYGRTLLLGDAAHPTLPFMAQGANMAIEDAGALHVLFNNLHSKSEIERRMQLYEDVRLRRANLLQVLSDLAPEMRTKEQMDMAGRFGYKPKTVEQEKQGVTEADVKRDFG